MGQNIESEGQRVGVPHEDLDPQPQDSVPYSAGSREPQEGFRGGGTPLVGSCWEVGCVEPGEGRVSGSGDDVRCGWGKRGRVGRA